MASDIEIITTTDGSSSLFNATLNETYHSKHGAVAESRHVFIKHGLEYYIDHHQPKEVKIFEVGLGTGLNAYLTALYAMQNPSLSIVYHAIDTYPMPDELVAGINYPEVLAGNRDLFEELHKSAEGADVRLLPNFMYKKVVSDIKGYNTDTKFDIIYFDAFAPEKQPEMWLLPLFEKLYGILAQNGIMVTYCAQGQFRRNLKAVGFSAERLPGPPPKREMTRVTKGFA
ncbi:MAG: tRNA (5-methylaminomethyl-2-thiouridine)(34)-methyltransferase MnmD [Sphingobacteriales bacterium JAD_PAG50586_3]|nr:MAG: tRNA (5-methylaminomethyl-2-thiouridine)(34)-methyltransferase MnmD [Sphingobacteriales bacterium JAD_PAG50586_3]